MKLMHLTPEKDFNTPFALITKIFIMFIYQNFIVTIFFIEINNNPFGIISNINSIKYRANMFTYLQVFNLYIRSTVHFIVPSVCFSLQICHNLKLFNI